MTNSFRIIITFALTLVAGEAYSKEPVAVPYGTWKSPITPSRYAEGAHSVSEIEVDGEDVYWVELQPEQNGRNAVIKFNGGSRLEVLPKEYNPRSTVHEYGGGDLLVKDGLVVFSNFSDQKLYKQKIGSEPEPISTQENMRYADCAITPDRENVFCVQEDHSDVSNVKNSIVSLSLNKSDTPRTIFDESDFVAAPRIDPTGRYLTWISWEFPNMPWDYTTLWFAEISKDGELVDRKVIASGASIVDPKWAADGKLYYVSDENGWWNLFRYDGFDTVSLHQSDVELSFPAWTLDRSYYDILSDGRIVAAATKNATAQLVKVEVGQGQLVEIPSPFVDIQQLRAYGNHQVVFVGETLTATARVVLLDVDTGNYEFLDENENWKLAEKYISIPKPITFGVGNGDVAHAFYYPPQNPEFRGMKGELPPMIVKAHGGPTAHNGPSFYLGTQFWTTRGYAVLDVNFRGSSGYGTAYRRKLNGNFGLVDVEDVVSAAQYAAATGLADPNRLIVRGGSGGGYIVLAALAFNDLFSVGSCYYGISDLTALVEKTHKFESRYIDELVAPYPERVDVFKARSPIFHLENFSTPVILFQGSDDMIVPPGQSRLIAEALSSRGVQNSYFEFEGEGHGFRMKETIETSIMEEQKFFRRILGF